jgi:CheY-like chemotaxis protein
MHLTLKSNTHIHVLLVENDPVEANAIALLLARWGLPHELTVLETASRAIAFLNRSHPFETAPFADLVLLG